MNWLNILWWAVYIGVAIVLQASVPGIDFLLPGFILAIQERNPFQFLWLAGIFILLQEGMGSMAFGGVLLWYSLTVLLFFIGQNLFEGESFLFIFLLSGCLGVAHYAVFSTMAGLQDMPVDANLLMEESVFQALLTPFVWRFARFVRRVPRHENPA